jgi:RNA polymerase sigma-70 factor (ECF subfamily)
MFFNTNSELDFVRFYNTYYKRFVRYAFFYVNNQQTAEDMTHDAILYYWENKKNISCDADVLGYLLLTIRNKCLNYLKHLRVENEYGKQYVELYEWEIKARVMTLEEADYSDIFTKDIMDIITSSLKKLPRQTQDIFIQNRFQNKSRKEIAADMGVSVTKIDYHINKANDMLYRDLKDYLPLLLIFLEDIL